ncbi:MAG TPA: indolepyruvate ferredoxin oxidoreductase subunit beta [Candidatus Methanofastidiosa archaeon]|nr:indolepyruvate ferredoxin oxidoreductase subunit beta [Candidatus Methanofastidiosa archaeon]
MGYSIVISGVGGQGVLVASQIIANAAIKKGMKVRVGETHGMAQRGGSVIAHVRFGDDIYGSITPQGEGDIMLAFEPVESLRYIEYMREGGFAIMNTHPVVPVSVSTGKARYPAIEEITEVLEKRLKVSAIDATALAVEAGNKITSNTVLIGAFANIAAQAKIPLDRAVLLEAVEERVPKKSIELNRKAFELGFSSVR